MRAQALHTSARCPSAERETQEDGAQTWVLVAKGQDLMGAGAALAMYWPLAVLRNCAGEDFEKGGKCLTRGRTGQVEVLRCP